ncbi:hypothetical protein DWB63_10740 [Pseudodesulfovibrio sp. S3]|nr:hypothetical protein DWB63_10740 [Pseudodesulfovibrio sp. S3]
MVLCEGTLFTPEVPFGIDRVRIKALLKPVRTRCELVICCAFKGRHDILERVIHESLAGRSGQGVRWMLAGSTEEDVQFIKMVAARTNKVAGFVCDNAPLGRKWQTCVEYAYHYYDAKLYAITGSDDILSGKLLEYVLGKYASNMALLSEFAPDLYCANEWIVYSAAGRYDPMLLRCAYKYETAFQPLGAGRFYSRRCLDKLDAHLFDSSRVRGLDTYGFAALKAMGGRIEYYAVEDGPIVSVKGAWEQLNSLDAFFKVETLSLNEFSFKGYPLLKESLHGTTFKYLFKPTNLGFQLFD